MDIRVNQEWKFAGVEQFNALKMNNESRCMKMSEIFMKPNKHRA